jgi:hypothetical protein
MMISVRFEFCFGLVGARQPWNHFTSAPSNRPIPPFFRGDTFQEYQ